MALDAEHTRRVVQFLTDVLANAAQLAATAAGRVLWLVADVDARQLRRQRRTLGRVARHIAFCRRLKRLQLQLDRRDIASDRFIQ